MNFYRNQNYYRAVFLLIAVILTAVTNIYPQTGNTSPVPKESSQMILVITDSLKAVQGTLFRFEKDKSGKEWKPAGEKIPVVLGKNGLGWGQGLHNNDAAKMPVKKEGDGRSPGGVFTLGAAFGSVAGDKMKDLKIPYLPLTEMLECIDDSSSRYYNQLVLRNNADSIDWHSSEKMNHESPWYDLGIVVNHNTSPMKKGSGSCIFLHNWANSNETSSGCTEMEPANMKALIYWLNSSQTPVLVQLTRQLYEFYKTEWQLPETSLKLP